MKYLNVSFGVKAVSGRKISGHGAVFGNVDLGGDIVMPGAFKRSIAEHEANGTMPAMLWQHQHDKLPGAWTSMAEDQKGLSMEGDFADTPLGNEARTLGMMRAYNGLSIGYEIAPGGFDFDKQGNRLLTDVKLWEVSLVTFPMNPRAVIETIKSEFDTRKDFEKFLRDVGNSHRVAKEIVSIVNGIAGKAAGFDDDDEPSDTGGEKSETLTVEELEIVASMDRYLEKDVIRRMDAIIKGQHDEQRHHGEARGNRS